MTRGGTGALGKGRARHTSAEARKDRVFPETAGVQHV